MLVIYSILYIAFFQLIITEVVQTRKRKFLDTMHISMLKAPYENALENFPQGVLMASPEAKVLFKN